MDPADFVPLGRIVKTHGLSGEVSVTLDPDVSPERLAGLEVWFVPPPPELRSAVVSGVRPGPKGRIVKFDGVDDIDAASRLLGTSMNAPASSVPELADREDEPDPIGLRVIDEQRGDLGTVTYVIVTGANDVWVVAGGPFGEVLIPVIDEVIDHVDQATMTARVRLLPGLIENE